MFVVVLLRLLLGSKEFFEEYAVQQRGLVEMSDSACSSDKKNGIGL